MIIVQLKLRKKREGRKKTKWEEGRGERREIKNKEEGKDRGED